MDTIETTDLVIIDATDVDEDPSTGSEIAKTLTVSATSLVVVAGCVVAYNRFVKPRVVAYLYRKMNNEVSEIIEGTVVETPETEKV